MSCSTRCKSLMRPTKLHLHTWISVFAALSLVSLCLLIPLQAAPGSPPPAEVVRELDKPVLAGSGRLRWLGISVYEAHLWTTSAFQPERFAASNFALEIRYARSISAKALADVSIQQMQALEPMSAARQSEWQQALRSAFPEVQAGDRITGTHIAEKGMRLYFNGQLHKSIDDPLLSQNFFAIWLSPATQEPRLRAQLLGTGS